ncbi:type II toxin-antitoxin system RelE/ParE family toxin [Spirulina sp. 06S082]|uniref:type II toxin-antitoxin system RelE/ParE family toxin n=1 Tax=Spirulina sp. 06S082 TaxID=3110248 RepID=UPI002B1ED301|nr:type II toxin-antitoxin system RelE/ParE family toxin [Spirulina sp. 06S082]MEA5468652.1 type II toxin-antitoxin system RelE/ParE family toxin [Spirulina sp. 06S082]
MTWDIEYTDEFAHWWYILPPEQQDDIASMVKLLEEKGTRLPFPYSSNIKSSKHSHLRELRIQSRGNPIRIFYAFDPRRTAILLIGGDKTGDDRFYKTYVAIADRLYDEYLLELKQEGLI